MKAETPTSTCWSASAAGPPQNHQGKLLDGGEEVVQRALALRCLEIPVGNFVDEASKGDLPQGSEAKDARSYCSPTSPMKRNMILPSTFVLQRMVSLSVLRRKLRVFKAWLELDRHPILKAIVD